MSEPDKLSGGFTDQLTLEPFRPVIPAAPGGPTGPCRDDGNLLKRQQTSNMEAERHLFKHWPKFHISVRLCLGSEGVWLLLAPPSTVCINK